MSKPVIVRLTTGIICGVIAVAVAAGWIEWQRRTEPLRPGAYAGEQWRGNGLNIPFRWCPPGTFMMGSPATEPGRDNHEDQVRVTLTQGFWMGQTEVTQGQWQSVTGTMPWQGKDGVNDGANFPAVYVSHSGDPDSAASFCQRFTTLERAAGRLPPGWVCRLPTEAEWEYSCRAGTATAFCFADDESKLDQSRPAPGSWPALPLDAAAPRTFSTGSVGYYWSSKATVGGHTCQVGVQVTVIGSKHWDSAKRAAWLAAAKPLSMSAVDVNGDIKAFSTGSVGWNINAKTTVAGQAVSVSGNLTAVKSKEWAV